MPITPVLQHSEPKGLLGSGRAAVGSKRNQPGNSPVRPFGAPNEFGDAYPGTLQINSRGRTVKVKVKVKVKASTVPLLE